MASAGHPVIPQSELLKFRRYYFVIHYGTKVLFRVFSCCFLDRTSKTIHEILEGNTLWNKFTNSEKEKIDKEPPESLDINVLNKICKHLWEKRVNYPSDKMKVSFQEINDERNIVSHEKSDISEDDLKSKLQEFGDMLEKVLDEAASLYLCHKYEFNKLKSEIIDAIPKIMEKSRERYESSNPESFEKILVELEEFKDELQEYIRERSVEELKLLYEDLCRILPFEWLTQYENTDTFKIIVFLRMDTDKEFHAGHSSHESVTLDQNKMLDQKDRKGNDPEVVIISGDPGAGKTSLLSSIGGKWYKKETDDFPNLSSYQILLHMEFRKDRYENFDQYIEGQFKHTVALFGVKRLISTILSSKCIMLCDSYDEKNAKSEKLFEEILGLKFSKIVVTTRPVNTKELTEMVNNSKRHRINLSILGLQGEQMERLIGNLTVYLVTDETQRDETKCKILEAVDSMVPQVKDILKNPLQLSLFVLLFVVCPHLRGSINSVSKLYIELQKESSKRLMKKLKMSSDQKLSDVQSIFNACCLKYAYQNKYVLREGDIKSIRDKCDELQLSFKDVISSYFNIKHTLEGTDVEMIYCYRHRSEQEFGAAGAICDVVRVHKEKGYDSIQLREEIKDLLPSVDTNPLSLYFEPKLEYRIVTFVVGKLYNTDKVLLHLVIDDILHAFNVSFKDPINNDKYDMDQVLPFLQEVNNDSKVVDTIVGRMKHDCGPNSPELPLTGNNDLSQVPSLLSRIKPARLKMKFGDDVNPDARPDIIKVFEFATREDVKIELHNYHNSEKGSVSYSDRYSELAETCDVFSGSLSERGMSALSSWMRRLELTLDIEMLDCLSKRLPLLQQLEYLRLWIKDRGSVVPEELSQLHHSRGELGVYYSFDANLDVNSTARRITQTLNCILKDTRTGNLWIVSQPKLTRNEARQVKESLQIPFPHILRITLDVGYLRFYDGEEKEESSDSSSEEESSSTDDGKLNIHKLLCCCWWNPSPQ